MNYIDMKKILLFLVLISVSYLFSGNENKKLPVVSGTDYQLLNNLRKEYERDSSLYKTYNSFWLDQYLRALKKQIQILNNKMLPENSWEEKRNIVMAGLIPIAISAALISHAIYKCYQRHSKFIFRKIFDSPAILSVAYIPLGCYIFHMAFCYEETTNEKLKKDKQIYDLLKEEEKRRCK